MGTKLANTSSKFQWTARLRAPQVLLVLLSISLLAAVACGSDRNGGDPASQPFQVSDDTMTWSPPWDAGDSRLVTLSTSTEFSPEVEEQFGLLMMPGTELGELMEEQTTSAGVITIVSKNADGSTAEYNVSFQEIINQAQTQMFDEPAMGDSDMEQMALVLNLLEQLDLGVEFEIDNSGAPGGVTNLRELAATIREFVDSFIRLAQLSGEEDLGGFMDSDDMEMLNRALTELPETESAQFVVDTVLKGATANLFLMRAGEYRIGEPVVVSGETPTAFGFVSDGIFTYELTDISNGTATMEVLVNPGEVDLVALAEGMAHEVAPIFDGDANELTEAIDEMDAETRAMVDSLLGLVFEPYTVTLTLDAATGWVTSADWSVELSLPDEFIAMLPAEEMEHMEFDLSELAVTLNFRSTFQDAEGLSE